MSPESPSTPSLNIALRMPNLNILYKLLPITGSTFINDNFIIIIIIIIITPTTTTTNSVHYLINYFKTN